MDGNDEWDEYQRKANQIMAHFQSALRCRRKLFPDAPLKFLSRNKTDRIA